MTGCKAVLAHSPCRYRYGAIPFMLLCLHSLPSNSD
nr:MAG TPA: hypothetical protein [Caudoviricetes sp.]